ncbi:MAG: SpoIID/LytB domain-containing protein [Clostridiales bacterium]|nr:SpoIID/LytB domain-containing protein [Clostridiales bacterium]MCF8021578.1 SpoIID/LytB domain-containing protein [Clostridiales bacterium]
MRKKLLFLLCAVSIIYFIFGCAAKPQKKPEGAPEKEPSLTLYMSEKGQEKTMKVEEYIQGVVAGEMEADWPVNALAAQAILARTYTMKNIDDGRKQHGADASTNEKEFQAYNESKINSKVKEAVKKTRGKVVTYKGEYTEGWFSACCGGVTAAASEGLTEDKESSGYLKPKVKDDCLEITTSENKHWKSEIPLTKLHKILKDHTGQDPGDIDSASIAEKGPSGRTVKVKLGDKVFKAIDLRAAIGPSKMRSTLLDTFTKKGDKLQIEGKGYGHGVGMCQWGAKKMAQEGKSPEEIIKFYYENIDIIKLWD